MIAFCLVAMPVVLSAAESPYDLVLRNARIVGGTGSPWYRGDVAIRGDAIARIAPAITEPATRVIDLGDLVAAPGFIDIHTHAVRGLFELPTADNYVRQGVTTVMVGPDGGGSVITDGMPTDARLKPLLDRLNSLPKSLMPQHVWVHREREFCCYASSLDHSQEPSCRRWRSCLGDEHIRRFAL
jgi:N-acyl-D-aspartate/D-glutamate deacylase